MKIHSKWNYVFSFLLVLYAFFSVWDNCFYFLFHCALLRWLCLPFFQLVCSAYWINSNLLYHLLDISKSYPNKERIKITHNSRKAFWAPWDFSPCRKVRTGYSYGGISGVRNFRLVASLVFENLKDLASYHITRIRIIALKYWSECKCLIIIIGIVELIFSCHPQF